MTFLRKEAQGQPPVPERRPDRAQKAGQLNGMLNSKMVPEGALARAERFPPSLSTIVRQRARPRPIPLGLVVKNGSKMRSAGPGSKPCPESQTSTRTLEPSFLEAIHSS